VAPHIITVVAVATKENAGMITSELGPTPVASRARWMDSVPEDTATTSGTPR
jgi:hypothetical protein